MSNSLWPHGLQHARFPCPLPTPRAWSNSCALSWWCHPTISSSVVHFSSCLQSFPALGSFPMSQFFTSGGQSIGASASVLPMNTQDLFPLGLTGLISLHSKRLSRGFTIVDKHQFFGAQLSLWSNSHIHTWQLKKPYLWRDEPLSAKQHLCFLICCLGLTHRLQAHNPLLNLINLLELSTELRLFRNSQKQDAPGRCEALQDSLPTNLHVFTDWRASVPHPFGFYGGFITEAR